MKKILFCLVMLISATSMFAQKANKIATKATAELAAKYELTEAQTAKMQNIQERKQMQIKEVTTFKKSDTAKYYAKMKAIADGEKGAIQLLLTKEQMPLYFDAVKAKRIENAALVKKMSAKGASKAEIEVALIMAEFE